MIEELLLKMAENSPTIAILGYIAYMLRSDLREYMKQCRDDNHEYIERVFALFESERVKRE